MSRIFEALQRSEAERSEIDLTAMSEATEVLRRVERESTSKWDTTGSSEQIDATKSSDREVSFGLPAKSPVGTTPGTHIGAKLWQAEDRLDPFGQFQSLEVSLTSQSRLVSLTDSGSPAAEALRLLGVRLRHLRRDRTLRKVLITSTIPQEGKSMIAANLACTLALRTQQRILVLEGDLRRPSLSRMFGLGRNPGLCELLRGERSLTESIYHLEGQDLWILPAGSAPSNALELLQSGRLSELMDQLAVLFDWIIIDSPPVLPLADTSVWMRLSDGVLLVARPEITEKKQLQKGLEAIEKSKLIGALLNASREAAHSDYYQHYGASGSPSQISPSAETEPKNGN